MSKSKAMRLMFTKEMYRAIKETAEGRGQPMAHLVREAIAMYLARTAGLAVQDVHPERGGERPGAGRKAEGGEG